MKLSEIKSELKKLSQIAFQLPNGDLVPNHFHVTEVGKITKHFIDCGGTVRTEEVINFQLWEANDYDHRFTTKFSTSHFNNFNLSFSQGYRFRKIMRITLIIIP